MLPPWRHAFGIKQLSGFRIDKTIPFLYFMDTRTLPLQKPEGFRAAAPKVRRR